VIKICPRISTTPCICMFCSYFSPVLLLFIQSLVFFPKHFSARYNIYSFLLISSTLFYSPYDQHLILQLMQKIPFLVLQSRPTRPNLARAPAPAAPATSATGTTASTPAVPPPSSESAAPRVGRERKCHTGVCLSSLPTTSSSTGWC
jgi:hypothetical protein